MHLPSLYSSFVAFHCSLNMNECQCAELRVPMNLLHLLRKEKRSCMQSAKSKSLAAASERQINWLPNISFFLATLEGDGQKIWKIYPRVPHAVPIETEENVLHFSDQGSGRLPFYLP